MAKFKVEEVIKVTDGELLQGNKETIFNGISIDSRTIKEGELFFALKGNRFDGHEFVKEVIEKKAYGAIVDREIKLKDNGNFCIFKVEDTLDSLRKLAIYHSQRFNIPIVAVTGSNGKTTVKEMTYQVLSSSFPTLKTPYNHNNQIGLSLTLLEMNENYKVAVFELGINHRGEMEVLRDLVRPRIVVFTNIGKSHLEFLESPVGVLKEEITLINNFGRDNPVIFNADDFLLKEWFLVHHGKYSLLSFGIENDADFRAEDIVCSDKGLKFKVKNVEFFIPLLGKHNIYNALSAIAVGSLFGIPLKEMALSLRDFRPPLMRLNAIRVKKEDKEFVLIDDTYNSNPNSVISAIDSLSLFKHSGRKILILGDMLELGKHSQACHQEIGVFLEDKNIDILLTIGTYTLEISNIAKSSGKIKEVKHFCFHAEIVEFLKENIKNNDVLLIKGSRGMRMDEIVKGILEEEKVTVL